jgi:hypothetical protein
MQQLETMLERVFSIGPCWGYIIIPHSQSLSQRWNIYTKGYISRGATGFRPVPHTVQYIYINDMPQTPGTYLGLSAHDTCICATHCKQGYVLRQLQWGLSAIEMWSYKIIRMNMFAVEDKAKPDKENIRPLKLAVVKLITIQVTKLLL